MKTNRLIAALGAFLLLAIGCEKEPMLNVPGATSFEFAADGAGETIVFNVNRDWTATPSESWITVSPSSGKASDGPVEISVKAAANPGYEERTATVTIAAEGLSQVIKVRQLGGAGFVVPKKSFELASDATSFEVEVQSNVEYSVSVPVNWIRQTGTKGLNTDRLTFSVEENPDYDARSAIITIKPNASGLTEHAVGVTQAQKDAILIEDTSYDMPYGGGDIEFKVDSNVDFEVTSAVDWIHVLETRGLSSSKVRLFVTDNYDTDPREGSVTVSQKGGPLKYTVNVKQAAMIAVTGIKLDKSSLELTVGEKALLTATVLPENASEKYVSWSSDNSAVAYVEYDGEVTAVSEGMAKITAKSWDYSATCSVKVEKGTIQITEQDVQVSEDGGTVEVDIRYNTDFSVEVDYDAQRWINYVPTRAMTDGKLQFLVDSNYRDDIRTGTVTVRDNAGTLQPVTISFRQDSKLRRLLMEFFEAMDGPHWTVNENWGTDESVFHWWGLIGNRDSGITGMQLRDMGLKGSIPACIGEFSDLEYLFISNEPGIVGALPESFGKLVNLRELYLNNTSMTSLPDIFGDMTKLRTISAVGNPEMTGPLPESIGRAANLGYIGLYYNAFTGTIPKSYVKWVDILYVYDNRLTGKLSDLFTEREQILSFARNYNLWQKDGYGFDISDIEIPGFYGWFDGQIRGTDGSLFTFDDVVGKSKYTVYVIWASWCPFSRTLMPALKEYYGTYRQDGLEIIATSQVGGVDEYGVGHMISDRDEYMADVVSKGYDQWYNFYWPDYGDSYLTSTPNAEVYDHNGNILFSSFENYPDPVRNRYGKVAASDLIPFLETLFGPASPPDPYASSDYSKDGEVLTLQKATVGKGINIVFLGDAYTDKDMGKGGVYETVMKQAMEEFFAVEPYKTYRNRFNVYAVKVVSKNGRIGSGYTTALGTSFGSGTYVEGNDDKCFEYALKVPGINSRENLLVSVLVNSNHNAGTAMLFRDNQSAVARIPSFGNDPESFGSTLQHEAGGHGFAFLADEYANNSGTPPQSFIDDYNEVYDKYGWFSNVDFTDVPSKVRWSAFLSDSRYSSQVGIFEGAALYTQGAWRPTANSIMRDNYGGFNAPSRWAIYKQIMKRSGEEYSWEKFLEYDAVNRGTGAKVPEMLRRTPARSLEPGAPPVIK